MLRGEEVKKMMTKVEKKNERASDRQQNDRLVFFFVSLKERRLLAFYLLLRACHLNMCDAMRRA